MFNFALTKNEQTNDTAYSVKIKKNKTMTLKAKKLKNGTFTISGITENEMKAIAEILQFAEIAEQRYENHPEETRKDIEALRGNETAMSVMHELKGFVKFCTMPL